MKRIYFILAILGFIAPNILILDVTFETGNILLWTHPMESIEAMFGNKISSAFIVDLLFVVGVFFYWSYQESKRLSISNWWVIPVTTMLFGAAGPFPMFLYWREKKLKE